MANVFETVRADREYTKYVKGVESLTGLVETLSGPGPFTLFVPTDAAFDRLTYDQQANLFADPEKLSRVLKYHIVPGYYTANDLLDRLFLKTLEGRAFASGRTSQRFRWGREKSIPTRMRSTTSLQTW
jgi:uncharacterized surface protein with fasciclin (FAS1) repeats